MRAQGEPPPGEAGDWTRPAPVAVPATLERALQELDWAAEPELMKPGHRASLLIDGDATFDAMLRDIRAARRYVHLETYIFESDAAGEEFAAALVDRARAGVAVRVVFDAAGSWLMSSRFEDRLREAGVQIVEYRPIMPWRRRFQWSLKWSRRDHRKILVVDGVSAFTGGINIGEVYAERYAGERAWRDTHIRLEGPVVADLDEMFRDVWHRWGGAPYPAYPPASAETVATPGTELCAAIDSDHRGQRAAIRRHYLHAIRRARESIWIANAYFIPDRGLRRALCAAARRGVDVRVIVPADSDVKSVQLAGEHTYAELLRGGVRLYQWRGAHMHAKAAVIDGVWSTVGSYNFDYVSLFWSLEVIVELIGREAGRELRAMFEADFAHPRACELSLAAWSARPWWKKLLQALAYRFRRWL